ncbi:MAG: hypothetical protein LBU42_07270 [Prevotellaceae bacterium]|nr:hypothetical protein [Prevotellaceae bacterium]
MFTVNLTVGFPFFIKYACEPSFKIPGAAFPASVSSGDDMVAGYPASRSSGGSTLAGQAESSPDGRWTVLTCI